MQGPSSGGRGEEGFFQLKRWIAREIGLDCTNFKDNYLKRRLAVRMRATKTCDHAEYFNYLRENPTEHDILLDDITINVTQFFRDPEVFRLLGEVVLPTLIYDKVMSGRKIIRLWSAGCASGEEAYSLAMVLMHLLGDRSGDFILSVHGTDIDQSCLDVARKGEYGPKQVENVPPELMELYFEEAGEGVRVRDVIRDITKFRMQDLFSGRHLGHYDLIACRNVMIYFSKQMQHRLFTEFHGALNSRGYLIIGKSETLPVVARELFAIVDGRQRIFQKVQETGAAE